MNEEAQTFETAIIDRKVEWFSEEGEGEGLPAWAISGFRPNA